MRKVKDIKVNGCPITLNELTVEEIINLLGQLSGSLFGVMFDGRLPLVFVTEASGLSEDDLKKWHPADVEKLISEVETVNPHCARLCQTMVKLKTGPIQTTSVVPAASLSSQESVKSRGSWDFHSLWSWLRHGGK